MKIPFSVYDFFGYLSTGYVILFTSDYVLNFGHINKDELGTALTIFFIILSYTIGHIVANFSSFVLEHTIVRKLIGSPEEILFAPIRKTLFRFIFPIYYKPFPEQFRKAILKKAEEDGFPEPNRSLFFHCHSIAKKDQTTNERLTNFLNLYGFSRNMCMALLISAIILAIGSKLQPSLDMQLLSLSLVACLLALGLFYRYLKFFKHYTEEVYRTYESYK